MISGEKIGQYISNPSSIEVSDIAAIAVLSEKYPYASSLKLLHLKALALNNDLDFENQLKITAIHSPDREHLYALIHSKEKPKVAPSLNTESSAEIDIPKLETPLLSSETDPPEELPTYKETNITSTVSAIIIEETENTTIPEKTPLAEDISPKIAPLLITKKDEIEIIVPVSVDKDITSLDDAPAEVKPLKGSSTIEKNTPLPVELLPEEVIEEKQNIEAPQEKISPKKENDSIQPQDELDVDIINKAIDVSYIDKEIIPLSILEAETTLAEITTVPESSESIEELNPIDPVDTSASIKKPVQEQKEPLSFVEWLRNKQIKTPKEEEVSGTILKTEKISKKSTPVSTESIQKETQKTVKPNKEVKQNLPIDALLDKFMAEEPRISKPVKDFYNPVKNAKESVEESDDLVSETLAKIYALQKNYSKAIKAYNKLILLYPEKKSFFASRIEKIREEIKKR